jgi:hypothetical protein
MEINRARDDEHIIMINYGGSNTRLCWKIVVIQLVKALVIERNRRFGGKLKRQ